MDKYQVVRVTWAPGTYGAELPAPRWFRVALERTDGTGERVSWYCHATDELDAYKKATEHWKEQQND